VRRIDKRAAGGLRPVKILKNYLKYPAGSALIAMGNTKVLCAASVEETVPRWLKDERPGRGWVTGEYSMLPGSSAQRSAREASRGKVGGRTQEIQRLIGRSLRAVVDLDKLGPRTIWVDCDVLQADGGTRTASVTGGFVALRLAIAKLMKDNLLSESPIRESVAAISVGMLHGHALLDLCYQEDFEAEVDMNVVMTRSGRFVEVQGTAESKPFSETHMNQMIHLAKKGIRELMDKQDACLKGMVRV
jgi:ribonuclease PH